MRNLKIKIIVSLITLFAIPQFVVGQGGVSSMSMGVSRSGAYQMSPGGQYRMPSPEMFRIEEFINYHRHQLPLPEQGKRVRLSIQRMKLENGKTVIQFGITTPRALDPEKMPPLNIVLVIDRSGSMSGKKITDLKLAIRAFIEQFREFDKLTIVGFSNQAKVHLEACIKTKHDKIEAALTSIRAGGGTNLHAGLMLGYEQAMLNFDPERTNRVILLTDGITNTGTTDAKEIARQSAQYNKQEISLSTIGLGANFNHNLLRELADAGKGQIHFVNDSKDIEKTFISEIDSLLAPAARNVKLKIDLGNASDSVTFFGYRPERKAGKFVFNLDDLNHGATQVILARLPKSKSQIPIQATLRYVDTITGDAVTLKKRPTEFVSLGTINTAVKRNYAIGLVAKALRSAAEASNQGEYQKAEKRLSKGIRKAHSHIPKGTDQHLDRIVDIANDYRKNIMECIGSRAD